MYEDHAGHGLIDLIHRDALIEGSHYIRPDAAGLDVAGRQVVQRVAALPAEQLVVELRLDLAVAHAAGADVLFHIRVAGAVQRKMADVPQRIHQRGIPVFGVPDHAARPLKKDGARLLVHRIAQPVHRVGLQRLIVEQQVRPMKAYIVQRTVRLDLLLERFRQLGQNIRAKAAVCIGRRHKNSPS